MAALQVVEAHEKLGNRAGITLKRGLVKIAENYSEAVSKAQKDLQNTDIDKAKTDTLSTTGQLLAGAASVTGDTDKVSMITSGLALAQGGLLGGLAYTVVKEVTGRGIQVAADNTAGVYAGKRDADILAQAKEDLKIPREYLTPEGKEMLENRDRLEEKKKAEVKAALEKD